MYENRFGRFTAVDPLLASGKSANPQTFNRFVYVGNNPTLRTDPNGLDWYYNGNEYKWSKDNKHFDDGSSIGGWNAVQFDSTGRYYYTGCRNADCTKSDLAVLKQSGGWDWSITTLSVGFPGFSMPNPFAIGDRIEGWQVGVPNFFKGIGNSPVETPILPGTPTSLSDFGVPKFFEYGSYRNTTQRMAGAESQILLTAASFAFSGAGGATRSALTNEQLVQRVANIAERRIGGTGAVPGTLKHKYAGDLVKRYQNIFGNRGLEVESSWLNRAPARYGDKGSIRFDVTDITNGTAYDFKFTLNRPSLTQRRIDQLLNHGPTSIKTIREINPR